MYVFIVNPNAGNGRANGIFEKLQKSQSYQDLDAIYYYSEYDGHAEEIAASLKTKPNITKIIVVGGDGTIHEVLNGLGETGIPIGFIPGGSGNDFARGAGIHGNPESILKQIINGDHIIDYWMGNYIQDKKDKRYFINSMGFGFDAMIAHTANESFYKKFFNQLQFGTGSYVIALLQVLRSFKQMTVELTLNGKGKVIEDCWLISLGNHPYYGGGMKSMPNAKVQPDKFSVLVVHSISKWKILALFMLVFTGKHDRIKGVELLQAESLRILSDEEMYMQVDGQTTTCHTATVTKKTKAINIISTGLHKNEALNAKVKDGEFS